MNRSVARSFGPSVDRSIGPCLIVFGVFLQGVCKGLVVSGRRHSGKHIEKHARNGLPDCVCLCFVICFTTKKNQEEHTQFDSVSAPLSFPFRFCLISRGLWPQMSLFRPPGHERRWSAAGREETN